MRACVFTFNSVLLLALIVFLSAPSRAEEPAKPPPQEKAAPAADKTLMPEEEDFSSTPYTEYGEFNEEEEEAADTRFFQFGRFFGIGLGLGYQGVTGNRGIIWKGGFPAVDFKIHYWFDFNFALDINLQTASHFYQLSENAHTDITFLRTGLDLRYYIDVKNLSAPITFANPYLTLGFGSYTKGETDVIAGTATDTDTTVGFSLGAGLEFALKPRKVYLQLEGKTHFARFKDTASTFFQPTANDMTGLFYTGTANLMFTW